MGRVPRFEDGIDRDRQHARRIEQQRRRPAGHAEIKTFIIGGSITGLPYVPAVFIAVDPIDDLPEVKEAVGFMAVLGSGTATLNWHYDDGTGEVLVTDAGLVSSTDQPVTTSKSAGDITLATPIPLTNGDTFRVEIVSGDGSDLSAAVVMTTRPA